MTWGSACALPEPEDEPEEEPEDELPEEGEWVIIYAGDDGIQTAVWNEHYQCWDDDEGDDVKYEKDVVTHWMSVPEPPSTDNFQP